MKKICILTSGMSRGSNFAAIAEHIKSKNLDVKIEFVLITRKLAPIQDRCEKYNVPVKYIKTYKNDFFESELLSLINSYDLDLIVLAGFMRKISEDFLNSLKVPLVNVHPALLPKFGGKGMFGSKVHQAVFEAKEKESGATVHFVNSEYDSGQIIKQESVDVSDCSSYEEIGKKVLVIEHRIYPETIEKVLFS